MKSRASTARSKVMTEMEGKRGRERQNEVNRYFDQRSCVVVYYGENYRPGEMAWEDPHDQCHSVSKDKAVDIVNVFKTQFTYHDATFGDTSEKITFFVWKTFLRIWSRFTWAVV